LLIALTVIQRRSNVIPAHARSAVGGGGFLCDCNQRVEAWWRNPELSQTI